MMSQTSANVDAKVNPVYADICIEDCSDVELLDGWEHWANAILFGTDYLQQTFKSSGRSECFV